MIEIRLPGRPVPWARARSKGKRYFTPLKQKVHQNAMVSYFQYAARGKIFEGPVELECYFDYSMLETIVRIRELEKGDYRMERPDCDNLVKQVMEALQASGLVKDDAQVVKISAEKLK